MIRFNHVPVMPLELVILNPTRQESVVQRFCVYKQKEPTKAPGIDGALKQDEQPVASATTFALMLLEIALRWWTRSGNCPFDIETAKQV
jgi:hypothetical protein